MVSPLKKMTSFALSFYTPHIEKPPLGPPVNPPVDPPEKKKEPYCIRSKVYFEIGNEKYVIFNGFDVNWNIIQKTSLACKRVKNGKFRNKKNGVCTNPNVTIIPFHSEVCDGTINVDYIKNK